MASGSPQTISFAPGTACAVWLPIPVGLIEKVDYLGKIDCKDHQHEHVRLHFVNPTTDEGRALANLLKHLIGLNESWLPQSAPPSTLSPAFTGDEATVSFGWNPAQISTPHIPTSTYMAWGWTPPWKWSGCAKCKLEVYGFLSGTVSAAIYAAGATPPGIYAAVQALLIGEYGAAIAAAAQGAVMSLQFDQAASIICKAQGKC